MARYVIAAALAALFVLTGHQARAQGPVCATTPTVTANNTQCANTAWVQSVFAGSPTITSPTITSPTISSPTFSGTPTFPSGYVPFSAVQGLLEPTQTQQSVTGVDFNSVADTSFSVTAPTGYTRYSLLGAEISNASGTLTTATFGVFTAAAGAGTQVIATGTAITVSTASDGTANNFQTTQDASVRTFTVSGFPTLFFRVTHVQGSAATATVSMRLLWLP